MTFSSYECISHRLNYTVDMQLGLSADPKGYELKGYNPTVTA